MTLFIPPLPLLEIQTVAKPSSNNTKNTHTHTCKLHIAPPEIVKDPY